MFYWLYEFIALKYELRTFFIGDTVNIGFVSSYKYFCRKVSIIDLLILYVTKYKLYNGQANFRSRRRDKKTSINISKIAD